jgi:hypothetical protein
MAHHEDADSAIGKARVSEAEDKDFRNLSVGRRI